MNALLNNAYDLHVHSAPDVMPRKMDDVEMAQRIIASGMKGYAIKSHYFCTSERAQLIRKLFPRCNAVGSITLNSAVGGINPMAVEMAGRSGAKIVWFPTVDSEHEQEHLAHSPSEKLPYWAKIQQQMKSEGVLSPTLCILKDGRLKNEASDVLEIIARFNMILATSHISKAEAFALVKAAKERKVERIIITHVDFPSTFYSIEEQKELLSSAPLLSIAIPLLPPARSRGISSSDRFERLAQSVSSLQPTWDKQPAFFRTKASPFLPKNCWETASPKPRSGP